MTRIYQVSEEAYNAGREDGWDEFECTHGYGIFDGEYPTKFGYISGKHIERVDIMNVWATDMFAANHAERVEGIAIIRDIPGLYKVFLDTPENRANILKQIEGSR
jgi:hypothetical protein